MLSNYKIDSCKINIPFDKCHIPPDSNLLTAPVYVPINIENGDIDLSGKKVVKNFVYGISTDPERLVNDKYPDRFLIPIKYTKGQIVSGRFMSQLDGKSRPKHIDSVIIGISSKACKELYFQGINAETLPIVYKHIIDSGQVQFDYETFVNCQVTDIDICADYDSDAVLSNLRKIVKGSIRERFKELCKSYNKNGNQGFELGSRKMSSIEKPYLKVYHKRKQMENEYVSTKDGNWLRNYEFAETYLSGGLQGIPKNLIRLEFNLKNKECLEHYLGKNSNLFSCGNDAKLNSLKALTSVTQDQWKLICIDVWSKWLNVQKAYMVNTFDGIEYKGANSPFEAMFIGLLMIAWKDKFPRNVALARAESLQYYSLALTHSEFTESERSMYRRRSLIQTIATWVYNKMQSETNARLLENVRKIEMHTETLYLLMNMNFPLTEVDLIAGQYMENVGRLGLYDMLNEN